jgi:hypothetical protein
MLLVVCRISVGASRCGPFGLGFYLGQWHEWNDMRSLNGRIIKIALQTGGMPGIDDGAVIRVLLQVGIAGRDNLCGPQQ